jgi:hypothetical protein
MSRHRLEVAQRDFYSRMDALAVTHLHANPSAPATVVHNQTLPAKEHDGQSRQLCIGPLEIDNNLIENATHPVEVS